MVNAISTAQMLGGNQVLGIEVRNDRDLEKIVSKGLPTMVITEVMKKIYPEQADKIYQIQQ